MTETSQGNKKIKGKKSTGNEEYVYVIPEVNSNWFEISNRFEMSFRLHGNLHGDLQNMLRYWLFFKQQ